MGLVVLSTWLSPILAGIFPLPAVGLDDVDAQGVLEQWLQTHTDSPAALQRIVRETSTTLSAY